MLHHLRKWVGGALLLAACTAGIPHPGGEHVRWARNNGLPSGLDSLREGRRLYVMKCDGCHPLYRPVDIATEDWPRWVDSMQSEIRLAEGELSQPDAGLILAYLMSVSGHRRDSLAAIRSRGTPQRKRRKEVTR